MQSILTNAEGINNHYFFHRKKLLIQFLAATAFILVVFAITPTLCFAASVTYGGITIENPTGAVTGVTNDDPVAGMITIINTTDTLTLSGTTTNQVITVNPGAGNTAHLVLDGLNIDIDSSGAYLRYYNAIAVLSGTLDLNIAAASTNTLL